MIQRHVFNIETDTGGDFVDTGPPMHGMIWQVHFDATPVGDTGVFDTGTDIRLEMVNSGVVVADYDNIGGASFTCGPRMVTYDTGGTESGDTQFVAAADRLRLTVNQSAGVAGEKTGKVYVWSIE